MRRRLDRRVRSDQLRTDKFHPQAGTGDKLIYCQAIVWWCSRCNSKADRIRKLVAKDILKSIGHSQQDEVSRHCVSTVQHAYDFVFVEAKYKIADAE